MRIVTSRLDYCNSLFSGCPNKIFKTLQFKILVFTYKAVHGQSPSYLEQHMVPYRPFRTLRSQDAGLLVIPRISKSRMGLYVTKAHICGKKHPSFRPYNVITLSAVMMKTDKKEIKR